MLDTIKIGLLRLNTKEGSTYGYVRTSSPSNPGVVLSHLKIPLHVAFDMEGYNSYKEYINKENPEFKTWVHDITLKVPPKPANCGLYPNAGHEWFLGNLRDLGNRFSNFPVSLKELVEKSIQEYSKIQQETARMEIPEDDYSAPPMNPAEKIAAHNAISIYGKLQRSRFDPGRSNKRGEFVILPFYRLKGDHTAKRVIEKVTQAVSDYVWRNPRVSKYSQCEGIGLQTNLMTLFLECFYKEQIRFMRKKLEQDMRNRIRKTQSMKKQ